MSSSLRSAALLCSRLGGLQRFASTTSLARTAMYDLHLELGGKMVPFAGYELPVQYPTGVLKEHLHTREPSSASLFDVSHMGQLKWYGKDRVAFLESMVVGDLQSLPEGTARLSVLTTESGGILDDTVITNYGDHIGMVVNGACKAGDLAHLTQHLKGFKGEASLEHLEGQQLLALQGGGAAAALSPLLPSALRESLPSLPFMAGWQAVSVAGIPCDVTRCGYTGEDGFEISVSADKAVALATALLEQTQVAPAGLGARDSLRLEAGLCLYGHDLDTSTSPVEGALAWTIGKRRRSEGGFLGADVILPQLKKGGLSRKRVGITGMTAPAREGAKLFNAEGEHIGDVTSGTFSPCLKKPVAMGYVKRSYAKLNTPIKVELRGKMQDAVVTRMPFVPANYYKPE